MDKLVFKDGTEVENGFASKSSRNQLMIRIPGNDLVNAALLLSNKEKTETIICYNSIYKITYTGYTDMYSVQYFADDDYVEGWLKPQEDGETSVEQEIIVPHEYVPWETTTEEANINGNE